MRRSDREVTKFSDIIAIIEKCDVCRLALLYFHGASEGTKLKLIAKDNRASFEMDCEHNLVSEIERGSCTMEYQSVIGHGHIEMIPDEEKYNALCILMKHYHMEHFPFNKAVMPRTTVYKLVVEHMTGKIRLKRNDKH